ncbi:MAG TPA: methyltransferase domain-containing protein, partial [Vicinamibacterales bacterium]
MKRELYPTQLVDHTHEGTRNARMHQCPTPRVADGSAAECKLLTMLPNPFARGNDPHMLVVRMVGAKMGDRLAQIGCAHGGRMAAVAAKVGLSGRAVAVVPDDVSAARAEKGAAAEGVLVEIQQAPPTRLPLDDGSIDLAIVDDT